MSGEKHTPGPWAANWSKYEDGNFIVQAGMPSNRVLAQFDGDGYGPDAQSIADAHLIAAAPDLLEALMMADAALSGANMNMKAVEKAIRAAIAKAKGGAA